MNRTTSRTGARILVDRLLVHGVERLYCVPGESDLSVLHALYDVSDRIRLVVNRHESGSALGINVTKTAEFAVALDRALTCIAHTSRAALIALKVDPKVITPSMVFDDRAMSIDAECSDEFVVPAEAGTQ